MVMQEARPQSIQQFTNKELANLLAIKERVRADGSHELLAPKERSLPEYITHFDQNWREEGLPEEWYNLGKKVGFSMDSQMHLLEADDKDAVALWAKRTKRDTLAFCLEYLSDGLVFPFRYEKQQLENGRYSLVDPKYKKEMLAMVSDKERGGEVKKSLKKIQEFFLDPKTPDGAIAIMPSPRGESGMRTDDGKPISYPDSYWFVFVNDGNEVKGCTIKTDLSLEECRNAIEKLTNEKLPENTPLDKYTAAVAFVKPWDTPWQYDLTPTQGIIATLRDAKTQDKEFAFKDKPWSEVEKNMQRGDELYDFNKKTQDIMQEFEKYVTSEDLSKLDRRKALGATILRLSKLFLVQERQIINGEGHNDNKGAVYADGGHGNADYRGLPPDVSFGRVLKRVEEIPGCAGGGAVVVDSITARLGITAGSDEFGSLQFECPHCKATNTRLKGKLLPNCKYCGKDVQCGPTQGEEDVEEDDYALAA